MGSRGWRQRKTAARRAPHRGWTGRVAGREEERQLWAWVQICHRSMALKSPSPTTSSWHQVGRKAGRHSGKADQAANPAESSTTDDGTPQYIY